MVQTACSRCFMTVDGSLQGGLMTTVANDHVSIFFNPIKPTH